MNLFRKTYHQLNTIEISHAALHHNYQYLSSFSSAHIAPVLKSNAYGHGLVLVAKSLDTVGAPFFCVDSLYEAYELAKAGIKTPLLLMGYTNPENFKVKKLPFSFAVYDRKTVEVLNAYQPGAGIHIFVDTGMNREGIRLDALASFLKFLSTQKHIHVEGLMSHFAASDRPTDSSTKEQVTNFQKAQSIMQQAGMHPKWIHIGNSAACLLTQHYKKKVGNLIRTGIACYGLGDEVDDKKLQPAMRVLTVLGQIKKLRKGEKVGYDFTYTTKKEMTIGMLPYGYYDGLDRRLSNRGYVLIDKTFCPIIGRVSMNITTVDISDVPNPKRGQKVTVYSDNPSDNNSFSNVAKTAGTIQRDLLVHLAASTKRVMV